MEWYINFIMEMYSIILWHTCCYEMASDNVKKRKIKVLELFQAYIPDVEFSCDNKIVDLSEDSTILNIDSVIVGGTKITLYEISDVWNEDDYDEIYGYLYDLYNDDDTFLKKIPSYITSEEWMKFMIKQTAYNLKILKSINNCPKRMIDTLDLINFSYKWGLDLKANVIKTHSDKGVSDESKNLLTTGNRENYCQR